MFGRNGTKRRVKDVAELVKEASEDFASVGGQIVSDEKTRQRVMAAVTAALLARQRARRQAGMAGVALRLGSDPVLRRQLIEVATQLRKAQSRVERRRSHKLRNSLLVFAGFGAASAAVAVPAVRERMLKLVKAGKSSVEGGIGAASSLGGSTPATVGEEIEVEVPVSTAYNQWTQFEQFPAFMDGVESVTQLDDTLLHWVATVGGRKAEWDAKILDQDPDRQISWVSTDGKDTRGTVTFTPLDATRTRLRVELSYLAEGPIEQAGSAAGIDGRRVRGDLERFKQLIESQGAENGAWRGEVRGGAKTS
jgi:uncharacterized membrane protein